MDKMTKFEVSFKTILWEHGKGIVPLYIETWTWNEIGWVDVDTGRCVGERSQCCCLTYTQNVYLYMFEVLLYLFEIFCIDFLIAKIKLYLEELIDFCD